MVVTTTTSRSERSVQAAILEIETSYKLQEEETKLKKQEHEANMQKYTVQGWISRIKYIYTSRIFMGICFIIFMGLIIPALIFYLTVDGVKEEIRHDTCSVQAGFRVSCGMPNVTTRNYCTDIDCCFDNSTSSCYHYLLSRYYYDGGDQKTWSTNQDMPFFSSKETTPYSYPSLRELRISTKEVTANYLVIYLDVESSNQDSVLPGPDKPTYEYTVGIDDQRMSVNVSRKEDKATVLDTRYGPTIASEGYLEWTVFLSADKLFGFGELLIVDNTTIRKVIYPNMHDHTTAASLIAYNETTKKFHGFNVQVDGMLDMTILPSKLIKLRSLFANKLSLHLFMGPSPSLIVDQHKSMFLDALSFIPAYWTLGVHICRDGITNIDSALEEFSEYQINAANLPYDSDCIHENLFINPFQLTAENKANITESVEQLKEIGKYFVLSLAPHVAINETHPVYQSTNSIGVLYILPDGKVFEGLYNDLPVAYPDYSTNETKTWLLNEYFPEIWNPVTAPESIGGIVLKNNWPSNELPDLLNTSLPDYFDEFARERLNFTLPWYAESSAAAAGQHSSKHERYGSDHATAVQEIFGGTEESMFILSASYSQETNFGALVQNVNASWANLQKAVSVSLYHSVFGGSLISVPVCGDTEFYNADTHEQLCQRWYQTAAVLPMVRISSVWPRRDPLNLPTLFTRNIAIDALHLRYSLLPYFYTISLEAKPVIRPMFYSFEQDANAYELDEQFMLGDGILAAPVLWPDLTVLSVYLPEPETEWFEFWGGESMGKGNETVQISVLSTDLILFLRSGHIVPTRQTNLNVSNSAEENRLKNPLDLLVALNCPSPGPGCNSAGTLNVKTLLNDSKKGLNITNDKIILLNCTDSDLTIEDFKQQISEICSIDDPLIRTPESTTISNVYLYGKVNKIFESVWNKCKYTVNIDLCDVTVSDPFVFPLGEGECN